MKKRFTEEQIVAILREGQGGQKTVEDLFVELQRRDEGVVV